MKILIEITDDIYEHAKETTEDSRDEFNAMRAIANGKQINNDPLLNCWIGKEVLFKIRDEIERITDTMGVSYNQYISKIDVLQIIDKYITESENNNGQ